jgi:hypothetical protein
MAGTRPAESNFMSERLPALSTIKKIPLKKPSTFFWKKESGAKKTNISARLPAPYKPPQHSQRPCPHERKWSKENQYPPALGRQKKILKKSALL